jgi:hypothetical protein
MALFSDPNKYLEAFELAKEPNEKAAWAKQMNEHRKYCEAFELATEPKEKAIWAKRIKNRLSK